MVFFCSIQVEKGCSYYAVGIGRYIVLLYFTLTIFLFQKFPVRVICRPLVASFCRLWENLVAPDESDGFELLLRVIRRPLVSFCCRLWEKLVSSDESGGFFVWQEYQILSGDCYSEVSGFQRPVLHFLLIRRGIYDIAVLPE